MACKVKSFTMKFLDWDLSWPTFWSDTKTISLPVRFRWELEEGSKKSNCEITQYKRGRVEMRGKEPDSFPSWVEDSGIMAWWNGSEWNGGNGSWSWFGNDVATFEDEPGFRDIKKT